MKIGILEREYFSSEVFKQLNEIGEVKFYAQNENLEEFLQDKQIIYTRLKYFFNKRLIDSSKNLKFLVSPTTGLNHIDLNYCQKVGIEVISLKESQDLFEVNATPENTFGLLLSLLRNYKYFFSKSDFDIKTDRLALPSYEIKNKKVGIIGFGRVGKLLSKYLISFGAKISFYDIKTFSSKELKKYTYCKAESKIDKLIEKNEIIFLTASHKKNVTIINKDLLYKMKDKYFINTSRGENVDEVHLISLVKENYFKGVAIDVIQNEQSSKNNLNKIVELNSSNINFIYTPHISGATIQSINRTESIVTKLLLNKIS